MKKNRIKFNLQHFASGGRLQEIETRLSAINEELKLDNADLDALETEINELKEERKSIKEKAEKRQNLMNTVASSTNVDVMRNFGDKKEKKSNDEKEMEIHYRNAFLKNLLGEELTEVEERAFVHTTQNTGEVVPTETLNKIYSNMEESHPILKDVEVLRTGAVISIVKHTAIAEGDAKIVDENEANVDEKNTFVNVTLSGKDFSKHVDFSYRLGKMAIPAFEQYLVKEIGDRLGAAMAEDIVAQIKTDIVAGNKVDAKTPGTLAIEDILGGLAKLKGTKNVNVYVNNTTLYNNIAQMKDSAAYLSFLTNYQDGVAGRLIGKAIKEEDAVADGEILILGPDQFLYNVVQDIMLERDKDIKKHVHTISGFAIAEGSMTNDKGAVVISVGDEA